METKSIELTAEEAEALKVVLDYRKALRDGLTEIEARVESKLLVKFPLSPKQLGSKKG